ncbi:hypothetical protein [Cyanobium sp. NIES-981]|uniref:hypothetical protein n=1 Tax=Cyanobium sp. NIES-981 TaxID=1851505 RepID=UPI0007DCE92F|nr:hypothetical protein [Cyanobium sp. NIES-981]SBO44982.1 conserved protein of unknown function [Cyanobium sp. NIES-981]
MSTGNVEAATAAQVLRTTDRQARQELEQGRWESALDQVEEAYHAVSSLSRGGDGGDAQHWLLYGRLINATTAALHPVLTTIQQEPLPLPQQAALSWRLAQLLEHHHSLPVEIPHWLPVLERQILQRGAVAWHKLVRNEPDATARARLLFERLATKLDPCPVWVQLRLKELASAEAGPPEPQHQPQPHQELVVAVPTAPRPSGARRLQLEYIPGAPVRREAEGVLALNLAAERALDPSGELIREFLAEVHTAQQDSQTLVDIEDPVATLSASLGVLELLGEPLQASAIARLPRAVNIWRGECRRLKLGLPGEGTAAGSWAQPPNPLKSLPLLIELEAVELAVLQQAVADPAAMDKALKDVANAEGNPGFWMEGMRQSQWWGGAIAPLDCLRRFRRDWGFHADPTNPRESFDSWLEAALQLVCRIELWGEGALWTAEEHCRWLAQPLLQAIRRNTATLEPVWGGVAPMELLRSLAEQEVVYVGPAARLVQQQHEGGNAWRLFEQTLVPARDVRCLEPPDGRYPHHPSTGLKRTLDDMIGTIGRWHAERPLQVAVVSGGAYRLPLCQALNHRYGLRCIALTGGAHELFGVRIKGGRPPRAMPAVLGQQIREEHWVTVNPADA